MNIVTETASLDLEDQEKSSNFNFLLVGGGDCRHILKAISQAWKEPNKQFNFYIIENNLEILARHMLLLHVVLEAPENVGLQEKTETFLEIFGNSLIREQTNNYIANMATQFIKMVTDLDYLADVFPLFDLSALKFKERDHLEAIFKFWRNPDKTSFDVSKAWDNRLRAHLKTRYDSRVGAFDWDYNMKLIERGGDVIHKIEYSRWRNSGVAFEMREGSYIVPNKTLASGLIFKTGGDRVAKRGYWGDIIGSPYLAFGIESENKDLFKKSNGVYTKTATDVSEFNVLSCLHELIRHDTYKAPEVNKVGSQEKLVRLTEITEDEEEEEDTGEVRDEENSKDENKQEQDKEKPELNLLKLPNVKIIFLPLGISGEIHKKRKYHSMFDLVYFSNSMVHFFTPEMSQIFRDGATVVCETARFMLDLKKEQCEEFVSKVTGMASKAGCQIKQKCNGFHDNFMRFTFVEPRSDGN
ncbi:dynein axonemal assembly factor 3-like isoform X2 [Apostichopus japonicus]|uniref:dynein axonemal assembly factor 3-like isoform X2 n=1 Tax=Stichopus japonicus TaxID=307972 RepID=UPI003AB5E7B8